MRERGLRAAEAQFEHREGPGGADAHVDQAPRGRELEALGGQRAAALLLAAHGGEQCLDGDEVSGDLVLARAAGELEPFGQAGGGRRPVTVPDVAERHPREGLGEQGDHPVLAGARGDAPVQVEHRAVVAQEEADWADEAQPVGELVGGAVVDHRERRAKALRGGVEVAREVCAQPGQAHEQEAVGGRVGDPQALGPLRDGHDRVAVAGEGGAPAGEAEQVQGALGVAGRHVVGRAGQDLARVGRHSAGQLDDPEQTIGLGAHRGLGALGTRPAQQRHGARDLAGKPGALGRSGEQVRAPALIGGQRGRALVGQRGGAVAAAGLRADGRALELVDDPRLGIDARRGAVPGTAIGPRLADEDGRERAVGRAAT